jgi:adenylate cyclase class 2
MKEIAMQSEIEAKFLNVNHEDMRAKLLDLKAECRQPMRLMRRVTIENDDLIEKNAFVRVRDEGHRVTMTYKQFDKLSVDGAKEVEITVNDFDTAVQLLESAGLPSQSFQESKRETWMLGEVEVVLDEWPWLRPYIEIEASTESLVRETAARLGFAWSDAVFGDVMAAYRAEYPHLNLSDTVGRVASVKFGDPLPDLLVASS